MQILWTQEETDQAKSLEHMPDPELARAINLEYHGGVSVRTASSIRAVRHRQFPAVGLPRWSPDREIELKKWVDHPDMMTSTQIGRRMGVSRMAVIGKCSRMGFRLPNSEAPAGSRKPYKKPKKKEPQVFDGISDTPDPLALDTPTRGSHCQYPIGDPKEPGFHYCGQPKGLDKDGLERQAYCNAHHDICHPPKD